jgi:hypothetical protein
MDIDSTTPSEAVAVDLLRYQNAAHAMQSGVAAKMDIDSSETTPKHLRVGVNSAMVDMGALVKLLIAKNVFTYEEYVTAVADSMEREKAVYEHWLREHFGHDGITLV